MLQDSALNYNLISLIKYSSHFKSVRWSYSTLENNL